MLNTDRGIVFRELDRLFSEGTLAGLGDSQLLERYLTRRDEAAFEALVDLHGPMVLGLCRRILRDPRDIEDAFQATFLVLVRKASSIRDRGLLSNWLYGVALKVAKRARASLRRHGRETPINGLEPSVDPDWTDLAGIGQVLDQELSRLPVKYRVPLVMCYLRGHTHDQAAAELSWPVGTVRSRMARGRALLKERLTRRGFLPSATLLGSGPEISMKLFSEAVPPSLVAATVEGAFAMGSSSAIQAGTAASVLALTQGVLTSMKLTQLKWIGLALLTTTLSTGGAIVVAAARSQTNSGAGTAAVDAPRTDDGIRVTSGAATSQAAGAGGQAPTGSTEDRMKAMEQKIDELYRSSGMGERLPFPDFGPESTTLERLEAKVNFFWKLHGGAATTKVEGRPTQSDPRQNVTNKQAPQTPTAKVVPPSASEQMRKMMEGMSDSPAAAVEPVIRRRRRSGGGIGSSVPDAAPSQPNAESGRLGEGSGREIRELESQLKLALPEYVYAMRLHSQHAISQREVQVQQNKVNGAIATLEGMDDDLAEAIETLELECHKKKAMLDQARAEQEAPAALVARTTRLKERKNQFVSDEDAARAESEFKAAAAHAHVRMIELEESDLRMQHLKKRRDRIQKIVKWATESAAKVQPKAAEAVGSPPPAAERPR